MFGQPWGHSHKISRTQILSEFERDAEAMLIGHEHHDSWNPVGQSEALIRIERFVNRVVASSKPAYHFQSDASGRWVANETAIGRRLRDVLPLSAMFDSWHDYSEQPCAFLHACWLMGSVNGLDFRQFVGNTGSVGLREAEAMNDIVERIRMSARESWYLRCPGDRSWEARQRAQTVAQYCADIFRFYARTMVVRIDLGYIEAARTALTIDQVYAHLDHLVYLKDWHPVFECLVGYVWSIEQGADHGFHIHCIFMFDGSKECRDVWKGFEIGRLWKETITGGMGDFENCNARKHRYEKLGIGMIHRASAEECLNAIDVLQYVTKDTQFLRIKPKGRRIFSTGVAPEIEAKRGRPAPEACWRYPA